jgi:hypothetical protein
VGQSESHWKPHTRFKTQSVAAPPFRHHKAVEGTVDIHR